MADNTQLIRGILEGCILSLLSEGESYGYRVIERLREQAFEGIQESTVYPILTRLEKRGLLKVAHRPSKLGPPRKYYSLTQAGKDELQAFTDLWNRLKDNVDMILREVSK